MAPPDESTRKQLVSQSLDMLGVSCSDSSDYTYIFNKAIEVINATPAILLDLCERLNTLLSGRASPANTNQPPVVRVRQRLLDDAVSEARQRVIDEKDSMEACAAKWIERNRRDGSLCFVLNSKMLRGFESD